MNSSAAICLGVVIDARSTFGYVNLADLALSVVGRRSMKLLACSAEAGDTIAVTIVVYTVVPKEGRWKVKFTVK